jgi:dolichol-phosphate mannosyltransferase
MTIGSGERRADRPSARRRRASPLPDGYESQVVVVLPTYQEALNIEGVLAAVREVLPASTVLVVDDNSPDGTADIVEKVAATSGGGVELLRRPGKQGLGVAYRAGFEWALARGAACIVEMDADGSHDPHDLRALVAAVAHGADLAIGSRYVPGGNIPQWAWPRRLLSRWANRYVALALGLAVNDATSGYRAYDVELITDLDVASIRADGYGFQIETTYRAVRLGAAIVEVPIVFAERSFGESKMSTRIVVEALALVTGWGLRDLLTGRRRSH